MLINNETLHALNSGFEKVFNEALNSNLSLYQKIATEIHSNTKNVKYGWLGSTPKMREWIGERVIKDIEFNSYSLSAKKYEATISVDADDILGDNLSVIKPRIIQMAEDSKSVYDEQLFELIEANTPCYDQKSFFGTHEISGVSFSNSANLALNPENLFKAKTQMMRLCDDSGRPLRIKPNLLLVPPELEAMAAKIVQAEVINNESNTARGMVEVLVSPYLSKAKTWYLLDTTQSIRPFILQIFEGLKFVSQDQSQNEALFMRDEIRYGVKSKHVLGFGLWQLCFRGEG